MRNTKDLALSAILKSLKEIDVEVSTQLSELIEDLVHRQWEGRNKERDSAKDEAELLKLIREYVARNPSTEEEN